MFDTHCVAKCLCLYSFLHSFLSKSTAMASSRTLVTSEKYFTYCRELSKDLDNRSTIVCACAHERCCGTLQSVK